jgi:hypothetical protein
MSSLPIEEKYIKVEVLTAVTMKNAVFWDVGNIPEDAIVQEVCSQVRALRIVEFFRGRI